MKKKVKWRKVNEGIFGALARKISGKTTAPQQPQQPAPKQLGSPYRDARGYQPQPETKPEQTKAPRMTPAEEARWNAEREEMRASEEGNKGKKRVATTVMSIPVVGSYGDTVEDPALAKTQAGSPAIKTEPGSPVAKAKAKPGIEKDVLLKDLIDDINDEIQDPEKLDKISDQLSNAAQKEKNFSARTLKFMELKKSMGKDIDYIVDLLINKNAQKLKEFEQFMRKEKTGTFLGVAEEILPIETVREISKMIPESLRLNHSKLANILF
jgi:hypothetical protein